MNKNELIAEVADQAEMTKAQAQKAVDAMFDAITSSLKSGAEVRIPGFGTFLVSERAESKGRDPRTGKEITIPAAKVPKFRAGKPLKDSLNG